MGKCIKSFFKIFGEVVLKNLHKYLNIFPIFAFFRNTPTLSQQLRQNFFKISPFLQNVSKFIEIFYILDGPTDKYFQHINELDRKHRGLSMWSLTFAACAVQEKHRNGLLMQEIWCMVRANVRHCEDSEHGLWVWSGCILIR